MNTRLQAIALVVETRLDEYLRRLPDGVYDRYFSPRMPMEIVEAIRRLTLRGGKRIRAGLTVCGFELLKPDGVDESSVLNAAAALELYQTYLLIHDDIMDEDDVRRGGLAVHAELSSRFDDITMGRNLGILAGDLACALAERLLVESERPNGVTVNPRGIVNRMLQDVMCGQYLDLVRTASPEDIVIRKTASYTTIGPLCVGAALAGADERTLDRIVDMARPLGMAFQYRDDLIGVVGSSQQMGKPVGSDLRNGKRTWIVEAALMAAGKREREIIESVLAGGADDAAVEQAVETVKRTGAVTACEQRIDALSRDVAHLASMSGFRAEGVSFLLWLTAYLSKRIA